MRPRLKDIMGAVSTASGVDECTIKAKGRKRGAADARHIFCLVASSHGFTRQEIADYIDRHHTTVTYMVNERPVPHDQQQTLIDAQYMVGASDIPFWAMKVARNPSNKYFKDKLRSLLDDG